MKVLLLGSEGQIGSALKKRFAADSRFELSALGRNDMDLSRIKDIASALSAIKPDIIINTAALTDVDRAEKDFDLASKVNAEAPAELARWSAEANCILIHFSTDYVFSGRTSSVYFENDVTNPINHYGKTKLDGEKAVAALASRWLIIRTSWVYSHKGKNFLSSLKNYFNRPELSVASDQKGCPTYAEDVAEVTYQLIKKIMSYPFKSQVLHIANRGEASRYDFAAEFFKNSSVTVKPVSASNYPTPAARPSYSCLGSEVLEKEFGLRMRDWKDALADFRSTVEL